jgi:hypothetical protein
MDFIRTVCDSMVMTDEFGGLAIHARMDNVPSAVIENSSVSEVLIILWGPKPVPTGVKPTLPEIPKGFALSQNYPNPFNPSTTIQFSSDQTAQIRIVIYDVLGREIRELTNSSYFPGVYSLNWDGRNNEGSQLPSGVYYLRMVASGFSDNLGNAARFSGTRKMLMMK